jgi:hypothetical protein
MRINARVLGIIAGPGKDLGRKAYLWHAFLPSRKKFPRSLLELGTQM